ncbi:MAG: ribosome silencing factor [Bacteroidia bacterium]
MAKTSKLVSTKKKKKKTDNIIELTDAVIEGIREKKGNEIVFIDLRKLGSAIADCFIVCHGESHTHVEAITQSVEEMVYKLVKEFPLHKEGLANAEWVLLDYFSVVVHIFQKEQREFYGIEKLWADARIKKVANH